MSLHRKPMPARRAFLAAIPLAIAGAGITVPLTLASTAASADSSSTAVSCASTAVTTPAELTAAFAAGGTVTLGNDLDAPGLKVPANGSVVLDLAGHRLTTTGTEGGAGIQVQDNTSLTVEDTVGGGSLTAQGDDNAAGIGGAENVDSGQPGSVTITGGTVTATGGQNGAGIGGAFVSPGGSVTVTGGTVTATGNNSAGIGAAGYMPGGSVSITGGSVSVFANGYGTALGGGILGGAFGSLSVGSGATLTIGSSTLLLPAGTTVQNDGTILGSVDTSKGGTVAGNDYSLSFDANGGTNPPAAQTVYAPSPSAALASMTPATAPDASQVFAGWFTTNAIGSTAAGFPVASSTLLQPFFGSADSSGSIPIALQAEYAVPVTTTGDLVTAFNAGGVVALGSNFPDTSSDPVEGLTAPSSGVVLDLNGQQLSVGRNGPGIEVDAGSSLVVEDIAGGGSLSASGDDESAAIGGARYPHADAGAVTITGGTVTATTDAEGAAIGGGQGGDGGTVVVSGGTVTATGGDFAPGIGGGEYRTGTVTVTGGTVTATGGKYAAGIGGGLSGAGGTVSVAGGSVTATGGTRGAGIGAGEDAAGGTVSVTGGTVVATAGPAESAGFVAAGIGSGDHAAGGNVSITGGSVTAGSPGGGDAIGYGTTGEGFGSLSVGPGATLNVAKGSTLEIPDATTVQNDGTITGAVTLDGAGQITDHAYTLAFDAGTGTNGPASVTAYATTLAAAGLSMKDVGSPAPPGSSTFLGWYVGSTPLVDSTDLSALASSSGPATIAVPAGYSQATVSTAAQLQTALEIPGENVALGANIPAAQSDPGVAGLVIQPGCTEVLDLAGFSLSAAGSNGSSLASAGKAGLDVGPTSALTVEDTKGGGQLTAVGGHYGPGSGGAGIGGGSGETSGPVTITGGTVTATGAGNAAGIGGGDHGSGGSVTVNGGTVTATGDQASGDAQGGAGIGGGESGSGGPVTINGGTVTALAGSGGAGIGAGSDGPVAGSVSITAGSVTATGGDGGAGIGGGAGVNGGTVAISGGSVTAIGGNLAAGIGGGFSIGERNSDGAAVATGGTPTGGGGTVTITGGTTSVTGGTHAAGIGGGGGLDGYPGYEFPGGDGAAVTIANAAVTVAAGSGGTAIGGGAGTDSTQAAGAFGSLGVGVGATLTVKTGSTLTVPASVTVKNDGTILGSVTIAPSGQITDNDYVLSFYANGGSTQPNSIAVYAANLPAAKDWPLGSATAPGGSTFTGWFTAKSGGSQVTDTTDLPTLFGAGPQSVTLDAQYSTSVVTVPQVLQVSGSADRSAPQNLDGDQTVSGNVFVFAQVPASDREVLFSLDGNVFHDEATYPFDFNGTAVGNVATPFSTSSLADGPHTISARLTSSTGVISTVSANFTVANNAPVANQVLQISSAATRSLSQNLDGDTAVSGPMYVFANVPSSDREVVFSLDGSPFHTEASAPFDFNGTATATTAYAYPSTSLANGVHTISVTVLDAKGNSSSSLATFTVNNGGTVAPPPAMSPLRVSTSADRSNPVNLNGASLTGAVYIFDVPTSAAYSVVFTLDGKAFHTESTAPYDFNGSGPSNALPYSLSGLTKGKHTITATTALTNGKTETTTSTFTVS